MDFSQPHFDRIAKYKLDLRKSFEILIDPNAYNPYKKFEEDYAKTELFANHKKKKKKKIVDPNKKTN